MPGQFTWERGPFEACPLCKQTTFGILSAGGDRVVRRCTSCKFSDFQPLPPLDKRVLYLDQNAFSVLFAVESKGRLPKGHENFAQEMHQRLRRIVLLQQAILPHSDIHRDETAVFHDAGGLRRAYEMMGGDVSLEDVRSVEQSQIWEYAQAFVQSREPSINFNVDEVLEDERNDWIPDMHISVGMDYSQFADKLRQTRDRGHEDLLALIEHWRAKKASFSEVLKHELGEFTGIRKRGLKPAIDNLIENSFDGDPMGLFEASHHWLLEEHQMIRQVFIDSGSAEKDAGREVIRFWEWKRNAEIPHNRISAYLFAGLARRVVGGQKRVTRGFMNDVRAISTYAPYVDAMFIDRECAELLNEGRLKELDYKAKIFSFADPDAFLSYLGEIEDATNDTVRKMANTVYGV